VDPQTRQRKGMKDSKSEKLKLSSRSKQGKLLMVEMNFQLVSRATRMQSARVTANSDCVNATSG
jgi:hypothetical protein